MSAPIRESAVRGSWAGQAHSRGQMRTTRTSGQPIVKGSVSKAMATVHIRRWDGMGWDGTGGGHVHPPITHTHNSRRRDDGIRIGQTKDPGYMASQ